MHLRAKKNTRSKGKEKKMFQANQTQNQGGVTVIFWKMDIMLSEINQSNKDKYYMFSLIFGS